MRPTARGAAGGAAGAVTGRRVLGLALPALVVLAAEPVYLLVDTAVVGHLGVGQLASLAIAGVVLAQVAGQCNFLAYGTTSRAARSFGAGDRAGAVGEGVQATWLALGIGVALIGLGEAVAGPVTRLLAGSGSAVAPGAERWLRVAVLGAPAILTSLAGNGWMRGVQDTRRPTYYIVGANVVSIALCPTLVYAAGLGLVGSAIANVTAQTIGAVLFLRALRRAGTAYDVSLRPDGATVRAQLLLGRDLVLRTLMLQACFLTATAVAARLGTSKVAAHQIALQLWTFLSLVLDSFAIAAQSLVGESLGAGDSARARATAWQVARLGLAAGTIAGLLLLVGTGVIPDAFTPDRAVRHDARSIWWLLVLMQPLAGIVFALDGVLMGAADVGYLRTITIGAGLIGFLPITVATPALGLGLTGIWIGLTLFIVLRLVAVAARVRGNGWLAASG